MGVLDHPTQDEVDLVRRAITGDQDAYATLVRRYQQMAVKAAYLIVGSQEAEDAAQDGFIKAYRALHRFRIGEPFRPWLMRIVTNEALNRKRSAGRRAALALRSVDHHTRPETPEEGALTTQDRQELIDALNSLEAKDRMIIGYRHLLEMDEQEVATILGVPRGTVKSRLSRAMARLKVALEGRDD